MKLSKSLLQAIVIGVSIGTATTSCKLIDTNVSPETKKERPTANPTDEGSTTRQSDNQSGTCEEPGGDDWENCAACGMG